MEEFLYLAGGIILLVLTLYDFFYTTLSGSGAAFISKTCGFVIHQLMLFLERNISRKVFRFSGMMVNLSILTVWVLLVWLGLFLVFSYNPEAETNSSGRVASGVESVPLR